MSHPQFKRIDLPNGRVGVTKCPESQINVIRSVVGLLPNSTEVLRVIPLGDLQQHPISWLWPRQPKLAVCLPDAFACALIELKQLPETLDLARLRSLVLAVDSRVELLQELERFEIPPFLPALAPTHQHAAASLQSAIKLASTSSNRTASIAVEAGLYLMNDCLDQSHECAQSIEGEGRHGDYWHAIMHRREPDYGNAKYWFRQVGRHPAFHLLSKSASEIISRHAVSDLQSLVAGDWDPFRFVDLCEQCARDETSPNALALREIQGWEMAYLLQISSLDATR